MSRQAFVPGHPAPQGSKRHVGNGRMVESSKRVAPWRQTVAIIARQRGGLLPAGPVAVSLDFVMPRPKRCPTPTPPAIKRNGDLDKLVRAVLDALTGVWIEDDSHVVELAATKRTAERGEPSGCAISVRLLTPVMPPDPLASTQSDETPTPGTHTTPKPLESK